MAGYMYFLQCYTVPHKGIARSATVVVPGAQAPPLEVLILHYSPMDGREMQLPYLL